MNAIHFSSWKKYQPNIREKDGLFNNYVVFALQGCGIVEDSTKMHHKCQSLCQRIHGLNDKAQQMDETKKRAVVGWRRQGIPILSQLLTATAAFNHPGCCPVVLHCEIHKRQEERMEGGQVSFILTGMNTEVMTMNTFQK